MMKSGQSVILPPVFAPKSHQQFYSALSAQAAINSSESTSEPVRSGKQGRNVGLRTAHSATFCRTKQLFRYERRAEGGKSTYLIIYQIYGSLEEA